MKWLVSRRFLSDLGPITILFLSLLAVGPSLATDSPPVCKTVKVAFAQDWFPVSFLDSAPQPNIQGVAYELINEIAAHHGVGIEVVNPIEWTAANRAMDEGKIDVLAGHYWSQQRANKWHVSKRLMSNDIKVFYTKDTANQIDSAEDLIHFLGVYPKGATYGKKVDDLIHNTLTTQPLRSNTTMLLALVKGRADYAIIAKMDGLAHLSRLGIQNRLVMSEFSLATINVHFSFSKQSQCQHLFERFNQSIDGRVSELQIQALIDKASRHYFMVK